MWKDIASAPRDRHIIGACHYKDRHGWWIGEIWWSDGPFLMGWKPRRKNLEPPECWQDLPDAPYGDSWRVARNAEEGARLYHGTAPTACK